MSGLCIDGSKVMHLAHAASPEGPTAGTFSIGSQQYGNNSGYGGE